MKREMRHSGIEWIGEIPKEWNCASFKYFHEKANVGESIDKTYCSDNPVDTLFYTAGIEPIHTIYKDFPQWKYTEINDLLLARNGTPYVYLPVPNSVYSDHIIRAEIKKNCVQEFIRYCLQQAISYVVVDTVSIPTWSISLWDKQFLPLPSYLEQQKIANYLDKVCGEVDEMIALQEQMIEELKAYKQSIITEAVTKGLNPNVPMKNSGIDWIGEVPEHWEIQRLRTLGWTQNGISQSGDYFGDDYAYPFVNYSDAYKNYSVPYPEGKANSSEEDRKRYSLVEGDVLFTRTSETIEEIGFSSTCLETIKDAVYSGFLIRFRPTSNKLYKGFSKYYFRSQIHRAYFVKQMNIVTRASLGQDLLKNLVVLLPTLSEQQQIASYLEEKCSEIDALTAIKQQKIEELKDYKKSVIYEYVTGKKEEV